MELPESVPPPPRVRGDPRIDEGYSDASDAARPWRGSQAGMRALRAPGTQPRGSRATCATPPGCRSCCDADGGGYANGAYILGLTNWALAGNVEDEPWLHLQTDSQNYAPIPRGSELVAEVAIADLFEKKGHEFVDLDVAVYFEATREAVMSARLRAIYQMRGV